MSDFQGADYSVCWELFLLWFNDFSRALTAKHLTAHEQIEGRLAWREKRDMPTSVWRESWEVMCCKDAETFDAVCPMCDSYYMLGGDRLGRSVCPGL